MLDKLSVAIDHASQRYGATQWDTLSPRERNAAIYHELCRIDSGCMRTGGPGDADLEPCPAHPSFIARRGCRAARAAVAPRQSVFGDS